MEERKLIPPLNVLPSEFPETDELPEGVEVVHWEDTCGYSVNLVPEIEYAVNDGYPLHIELYRPMAEGGPLRNVPLIIHIQGSAWMKQEMFASLRLLTRMAERGFAVASVEYRPSAAAPFPAQVEDVKTGAAYICSRAEEFGFDLDRVSVWGDSSGGHTSLLVGITGDRELVPEGLKDFPRIRSIVDWYGPTEIAQMNYWPSNIDHTRADSPEGLLIGGVPVLENPERAEKTVVMNYLRAEVPTPPMLIMHGGSDMLVPFNQSCRLYRRMKELGKDVTMIKLAGANHGFAGFQSEEALDCVAGFIRDSWNRD